MVGAAAAAPPPPPPAAAAAAATSNITSMTKNTEDVIKMINDRFDNVLIKDYEEGKYKMRTCVVCDEIVAPHECVFISLKDLENCRHLLSVNTWNYIIPTMQDSYAIQSEDSEVAATVFGLLLSPRAAQLRNQNANTSKIGKCFTGCKRCKYSLVHKQMPPFAIANNYALGSLPECLAELNQIEVALLTPVKTYGYCFSYTGGTQKQLKGSLSYYKVKIESIARAVESFVVSGLTDNIVIVYFGTMTAAQKKRAKSKHCVRTAKVLRAMEWLMLSNEQWRRYNIDLNEVRNSLKQPVVIDDSITVPGALSQIVRHNIEDTDTFQVYFPDGTMSPLSGGQHSTEKFTKLVADAAEQGYDIEMQATLLQESVQDYQDDNLVNACLLQYPYGRGGIHETRMQPDGSFRSSTDIKEYAQHICKLSPRQYHEELFVLTLYNMVAKQNMLRAASLRTRNKFTAESLSSNLSATDVNEAVQKKRRGFNYGSTAGSKLLGVVDATTQAVPHTNEAARKARRYAESLQHEFGISSYFLTFAPDDDNSCFLLQVFSNEIVDDDTPIEQQSNDELRSKAKKRTEIRLRYPGLSAHMFEVVLDIVIEEVIGWDLKNNCAKDAGGYFGKPLAYVIAIEEQDRRSLHAHIQIWIEGFNQIRDTIFKGSRQEQFAAKNHLSNLVDKTSSSKLLAPSIKDRQVNYAAMFPHKCKIRPRVRRAPQITDHQGLRNLRHRMCDKKYEDSFAVCPECHYHWSKGQFVESYLMHSSHRVPGLTSFQDQHTRRLKSYCVRYQKPQSQAISNLRTIIDAAYNFHEHTASCFKAESNKKGKKRSRKELEAEECRYHFPRREKKRTHIESVAEKVPWFDWTGQSRLRSIQEVHRKRHQYDAFQNVSCPAISWSKICGNSNITWNMYGPISQYNIKYTTKGNQEEETHKYGALLAKLMKVLETRKHDKNTSEAVRRVMAGAYAHQQQNVIGAPLASYLTRNPSRFLFSHTFQWIPIRDIKALLSGNGVTATISYNINVPYLRVLAMNYLCRPKELEAISVVAFYSKYEPVNQTSKNRNELLQFIATNEFTHPSFRSRSGKHLQGVRLRKKPAIPSVLQYEFPDTAGFGGNILNESLPISEATEKYAELCLLLFLPYRSMTDLKATNTQTYTDKLRSAVRSGVINTQARTMLQNIQDSKSNSFRLKLINDDLQRVTKLHVPESRQQQSNDDEEDDVYMVGPDLDKLIELTEQANTSSPTRTSGVSLSLAKLRNKGAHQCGYKCLCPLSKSNETDPFVITSNQTNPTMNVAQSPPSPSINVTKPSASELVALLFTKTSRKQKTFHEMMGPVDVYEANGSVRSIVDWATKAGLDIDQRRAFEIITATFILTFFNDPAIHQIPFQGRSFQRRELNRSKQRLRALVNQRNTTQLVYFLHGPGGCGKSTVIDLVLAYAADYCSYLEGFKFTTRTIVVTAMTGVAASLIRGTTTHSALYLNNKRILPEHIELWEETRMVLIDEISFADKDDFVHIDTNLRALKQKPDKPYGGLDIIFSGDLRQLEPVGAKKKAIYMDNCPQFESWVNCYTELKGLHRFKDDPEWGRLLNRLRNGKVTLQDITEINRDCVFNDGVLPQNTQFGCYNNNDRDSINTGVFSRRCEELHRQGASLSDTLLILSDDYQVRNGNKQYIPFTNNSFIWQNCGEDEVKVPRGMGRVDPVLKLYKNCPVMLTTNTDVGNGQANGTKAYVTDVILKPLEATHTVMLDGRIPVQAVTASQVAFVTLRHKNPRINPPTFTVAPKNYTNLRVKVPKPNSLQYKNNETEILEMKATQLPFVVNHATTGHKLQGSSLDSIFVHSWSYRTNWVYVVMSRVRTRKGFLCRLPLSTDLTKYTMPNKLKQLLAAFKKQCNATILTSSEYEAIIEPTPSAPNVT